MYLAKVYVNFRHQLYILFKTEDGAQNIPGTLWPIVPWTWDLSCSSVSPLDCFSFTGGPAPSTGLGTMLVLCHIGCGWLEEAVQRPNTKGHHPYDAFVFYKVGETSTGWWNSCCLAWSRAGLHSCVSNCTAGTSSWGRTL